MNAVISIVSLLSLLLVGPHSYGAERQESLRAALLNDDGFGVQCLDEFWAFDGASLSGADAELLGKWYGSARFKSISPQVQHALFRMGPWRQGVSFVARDGVSFYRRAEDQQPHTMLEISVGNDERRGRFIRYGEVRSMRTGVPYEVEVTLSVLGSDWWKTVPWAVVFQGHAIPDPPKEGQKFNPPFALIVSRGRWEAHVRADGRERLPDDRSYARNDRFDLGRIQAEVPVTFRIRALWSPEPDSGLLAVWRDGRRFVAEAESATFYRTTAPSGELMGPYVTVGLYMPLSRGAAQAAAVRLHSMTIRGGDWPTRSDCTGGDLPDYEAKRLIRPHGEGAIAIGRQGAA